jgi:aspartate-semialdehyde dehydrogenase
MSTLRVAVAGATGVAGQQALVSLDNHPWFEVVALAASSRSAGKKYTDAITAPNGALRWACNEPIPEWAKAMTVQQADEMPLDGIDVLFNATESDAAKIIEPRFAEHIPVISTASAFRYEADVPIYIPGVNLDHVELLRTQQKNRGWKGFVIPIPNCTTTGLAVSLAPLVEEFGIEGVAVMSMQALSGGGRSPGVLGLDILDNVIPYIPGEEEKVEIETQKILGAMKNGAIVSASFPVSATCTRVNVLDGHTEAVFAGLKKKASVDEVADVMRSFGKELNEMNLPSAPEKVITVLEDPFHPQPRVDRDRDGGMTTSVGRIREDNLLPNGIKYVLVSHNTKAGAAKGATLVAEVLVSKGYIG